MKKISFCHIAKKVLLYIIFLLLEYSCFYIYELFHQNLPFFDRIWRMSENRTNNISGAGVLGGFFSVGKKEDEEPCLAIAPFPQNSIFSICQLPFAIFDFE